jgi:hypothetical protein
LILRARLVVVETGSRGLEVGDLDFIGIDFVYLCEVPSFVVLLCLAEDEDAFLERVDFGVCFCAAPSEVFHGEVVVAGARMVHPLLRYEHPDVAFEYLALVFHVVLPLASIHVAQYGGWAVVEVFSFPGPLDDLLLYWGSVEVHSVSDEDMWRSLVFCLVEAVGIHPLVPLRLALHFAGLLYRTTRRHEWK